MWEGYICVSMPDVGTVPHPALALFPPDPHFQDILALTLTFLLYPELCTCFSSLIYFLNCISSSL